MIGLQSLPALNAILNATSAVLILTGFRLIRQGRRETHKRVMLAALTVSILFLISYLVYHSRAGLVRYSHTGPIRTIYLSILFTHTALAATMPVLAIVTVRRALKGEFLRHRRLARWTFPIWLYVSVTGVVVYFMLYQF